MDDSIAHLAPLKSWMPKKDWAEDYPLEERFDRNFFKSIQIDDSPISNSEIQSRLAEFLQISASSPRVYPPQLLVPNQVVLTSGFVIPYWLHPKLKSEMMTKVWLRSKSAGEHIPLHKPTDKDQEFIPDEERKPVQIEELPIPELQEETKWTLLNNASPSWEFNMEAQEEEKSYYEQYRKPFVKIGSFKIPERQTNRAVDDFTENRMDVFNELKEELDDKYVVYTKSLFAKVIEEIDSMAWLPENQYNLPVFKSGGAIFKEWKKDTIEMIPESSE